MQKRITRRSQLPKFGGAESDGAPTIADSVFFETIHSIKKDHIHNGIYITKAYERGATEAQIAQLRTAEDPHATFIKLFIATNSVGVRARLAKKDKTQARASFATRFKTRDKGLTTVFVSNVPPDGDETDLKELVRIPVSRINVVRKGDQFSHTGNAFIVCFSSADAQHVINTLHKARLGMAVLSAQLSHPSRCEKNCEQ